MVEWYSGDTMDDWVVPSVKEPAPKGRNKGRNTMVGQNWAIHVYLYRSTRKKSKKLKYKYKPMKLTPIAYVYNK